MGGSETSLFSVGEIWSKQTHNLNSNLQLGDIDMKYHKIITVFFICLIVYLSCYYLQQNPGFDFSKADISGNYSGGGPQLPS